GDGSGCVAVAERSRAQRMRRDADRAHRGRNRRARGRRRRRAGRHGGAWLGSFPHMSVSAEQRRVLFGHRAGWIALGFGSGLSPIAPGTAGSLAALVPWLIARGMSPIVYAVFLVVTFALGIWACDWAVRKTTVEDPSFVVWDEFV